MPIKYPSKLTVEFSDGTALGPLCRPLGDGASIDIVQIEEMRPGSFVRPDAYRAGHAEIPGAQGEVPPDTTTA